MKKLTVVIMALAFNTPLSAQELRVADGSSSGTYQQMLKEIGKVCGDAINIVEVPSSGAIDNLDKVIGNEANAAFLHSDVIAFRSKTEDLSHLKTLLALFSEDVHFVTLNRPYRKGNLLSFAKGGANLESVTDLEGLTVGAAGGGFITAQVIRLQGEIGYTVRQYDSGKEVLNALGNGEIAAAVFVGAAPLPNLKDLGKEYKLLAIGETTASRLKSVYHTTSVTYTKMSPAPVPTVAADALLITREYKTPKFVNSLRQFRTCFQRNLDELKETPGTHKAWQQVDISNHGKWTWYDFGNSK